MTFWSLNRYFERTPTARNPKTFDRVHPRLKWLTHLDLVELYNRNRDLLDLMTSPSDLTEISLSPSRSKRSGDYAESYSNKELRRTLTTNVPKIAHVEVHALFKK